MFSFLVGITVCSSYNFEEAATLKFKKLSLLMWIKKDWECRFELRPRTRPQYLHITFTAITTMHIGNILIVY
jgi:hypothetical protein